MYIKSPQLILKKKRVCVEFYIYLVPKSSSQSLEGPKDKLDCAIPQTSDGGVIKVTSRNGKSSKLKRQLTLITCGQPVFTIFFQFLSCGFSIQCTM